MAVRRLRLRLAIEIRTAVDPSRLPSPLWKSRCQAGRISVSTRHENFPALLAEALDVVVHEEVNMQRAAKRLQCTASQLIKLLKEAPEALQLVNRQRQSQGLPRLR